MKMLLVVSVLMLGMLFIWIWLMVQPIRTTIVCPDEFMCNDIGTDVKCDPEAFQNRTQHKISALRNSVMPYVRRLDARSCEILDVRSRTFSELTQLVVLDISENNITELKDDTFHGLINLKDLDVRRCEIAVVDKHAFNGLTALVTLSLSYNNIQELKPFTFNSLSELESLFLENNRIETIKPEVFIGLTKLQILKLSENRIGDISLGVLAPLPALSSLDMSGNNGLGSLDENLFARNPYLRELQLSRCNISSISLTNLVHLERLEIRENILENVSLGNVTALNYIDVSYNRLTNLSTDMFRDMPTLSNIYFDDNLLQCDCELYRTWRWFVNRSIETGWNEYPPMCKPSADVLETNETFLPGEYAAKETQNYTDTAGSQMWWEVCRDGNTSVVEEFPNLNLEDPDDPLMRFMNYRNFAEPVVATVVFIFGAVGNAFILVAVLSNKSMRNVPNMYVLNLAVIDLISLILVLPVEQLDWIYLLRLSSTAMCRLLTFSRRLSLAVSAYSVAALSIQRFIVTTDPMQVHTYGQPTWCMTGSIISVIWTTAILFSLPATISSEATIQTCGIQDDVYSQKVVIFELFALCVIPLSVIVFTYLVTAWHLVMSGRTMKEHPKAKARNKIAKVVLGLTFVFLISYVPYHIVWTYVVVSGYRTGIEAWYTYLVFSVLLVVNPCFNPVALFFSSSQFRREFRRYMRFKVAKE